MPKAHDTLRSIVTDDLFSDAQEVVQLVRQTTTYPFLLDAKIGDANSEPIVENAIASTYETPLSTISQKVARIMNALAKSDQEHGNPLAQIAQRANDVMAQAAIVNRHNRRPPLYAESTIGIFVDLGFSVPEHSPLIRAAGYVSTPPIFPTSQGIDSIISDIAAHMARSHAPQSPDQILESLKHRQDTLAKWPQLDLTLFIHRTARIKPDDRGFYHPDQPWGRFLSAQRLVANTMLRIFARDQQPRTTAYLVDEIERLVGSLLPDQYNTMNAVRMSASTSGEVTWQGPSTFGLRGWDTALDPQNMVGPRGRIGDLIYTFLMQHGPADIDEVIEHFQQTTHIKKRTIQTALIHDHTDRFIQIADQRLAANPIPQGHNPGAPSLLVVSDEHRHQPDPVLHESELVWLTRYVQALNDLTPPLPERVAITGPRAAGFAQGEPMEITVVIENGDRHRLEPRLSEIATATSELVPSVRPHISILSPEQWADAQAGEAPETHHNTWLAPRPGEKTHALAGQTD